MSEVTLDLADTLNLSDATVLLMPCALDLGDYLLFQDSQNTFGDLRFQFTDSISLSDSVLTGLGNLNLTISDVVALTDDLSLQLVGQLSLLISDSIVLSDAISPSLLNNLINLQFSDSISIGDTLATPAVQNTASTYYRRYLNDVIN